MLQIRRLAARSVKKYAVYSIALLMCIITFSNIYCISCLADEADPVSSATETSTQSYESSTESITDVVTVSTEKATEEATEVIDESDTDFDDKLLLWLPVIFLLIIILLNVIDIIT